MASEITKKDSKIDEGLYSRQLYVLGHDAMQKMAKSSVLITGCNGLGVEIAKNLILAGIKKVVICDKEPLKLKDFGTNFMLDKTSLINKGKVQKVLRIIPTIKELQKLNPSCEVEGIEQDFFKLLSEKKKKKPLTLKTLLEEKGINILVSVNKNIEKIMDTNDFCRNLGIKFISVNSHGFFGYIFNDFGSKHEVIKQSDKELSTGILDTFTVIKTSSSEEEEKDKPSFIKVSLVEESRHGLEVGDLVKFSEMGFSSLLKKEEKRINPFEGNFEVKSILDLSTFTVSLTKEQLKSFSEMNSQNEFEFNKPFQKNGKFEQIDKHKTLKMVTFGDLLDKLEDELQEKDKAKFDWFHSKVQISDFFKEDRKEIYLAILSSIEVLKDGVNSIKPHKQKYTKSFLKQIESFKSDLSEKDKEWLSDIARALSTNLVCVNSVIGGIASQEVLKAASQKFTPIDQILFLDFSELAPKNAFREQKINVKGKEEFTLIEENKDFRVDKNEKDEMVAAFGKSFLSKIEMAKGLIVGSGAIGCELLKNLALSNFFSSSTSSSTKESKNSRISKLNPLKKKKSFLESKNKTEKESAPKESVTAKEAPKEESEGAIEGELILVDDDVVERSNLSRQFLFRDYDINSPKAEAAAKAVRKMNPFFNIKTSVCKMDASYKNLNQTMTSRDILFTALDNIEARLFVDENALFYSKPLFESGTLGLKGNVQPIIPNLTENYGAQRDPEEKGIPVCTLKHYPYKPEHVVHWARDLFDGEFRAQPESVGKVYKAVFPSAGKGDEEKLNKLKGVLKNEEEETKELVKRFFSFSLGNISSSSSTSKVLEIKNDGKEEALKAVAKSSVDLFFDLFVNNVLQLLHSFPADAKNSSGQAFWSGTKRCPVPAKFDLEDAFCREFLEVSIRLKCEVLKISCEKYKALLSFNEFDCDEEKKRTEMLKELLGDYLPPKFVPSSDVKIPENEEEEKKLKGKQSEEPNPSSSPSISQEPKNSFEIESKQIKILNTFGDKISPLEFEKDDDKNGHMKFITAAANLRALNYKIISNENPIKMYDVKKIAGRIVPAIATTTAVVAGLSVLEALKYFQGAELDDYKSTFANLSIPLFTMTTPMVPEKWKIKLNRKGKELFGLCEHIESSEEDEKKDKEEDKEEEVEIDAWKKMEIRMDKDWSGFEYTLEDLMMLTEACGWKLSMANYGTFLIYSIFMGWEKLNERLGTPLVKLLKENEIIKEVPKIGDVFKFDIMVSDKDGEDLDLPVLVLRIKEKVETDDLY